MKRNLQAKGGFEAILDDVGRFKVFHGVII